MKGKRFTEEQIIAVLKEHEAGAKVPDLVRKYYVSEESIYRWRAKYGGMEVSEAKRLRELENENSRLKRLLAEAILDHAALTELVGKMYGPPRVCKTNNWRVILSSKVYNSQIFTDVPNLTALGDFDLGGTQIVNDLFRGIMFLGHSSFS